MSALTMKTNTDDSRIGSHRESSPVMTTSLVDTPLIQHLPPCRIMRTHLLGNVTQAFADGNCFAAGCFCCGESSMGMMGGSGKMGRMGRIGRMFPITRILHIFPIVSH